MEYGNGIKVFPPDMPPQVKTRKIVFFIVMCVIIFVQCGYFLFANKALPIVMGMPFSMFFVVLFIAIEFAVMLLIYFMESKEMAD